MKKLTTMTGILLLAGLMAFPLMAFAQDAGAGKTGGKMTGMQRGKGQMGTMMEKTATLTAEQQEQIETLQKKYREDNAETIKNLMTKRFDLNTILTSDKPDLAKAKAVQKDISELTATLAQKRLELYFEIRKINPDAKFGQGFGEGRGMRGTMNAPEAGEEI